MLGILFIFISIIQLKSTSCDLVELSDIIIREHTSIGHLLLKFNTSIHQRYSYRFVNPNHREIQQYFSLNSTTGELRVETDIDRESICTQRHVQCRFLLKIFELYHEKLYHVPIVIEDINDHRPMFPYESSNIILHISENSPPYQSKLFIQQAYDHDELDSQYQLTYQLKNLDEDFPFVLEINDDLSNRLALLLIRALDRETTDAYNCTIYVTDTSGHHNQLHINILVDDVNDQSPVFEKKIYSIAISENAPINTTIVQVRAFDGDIGLNGRITYDFTDASKQFNKLFSIDQDTGIIRLRSSVDYEERASYVFYIEARDSGKEMRSSQTLINITVLDENDCYPIINFRFLPEMNSNVSSDFIEISENYSIDKFFIKILITDQDSPYQRRIRLWHELLDNYNKQNQQFHLYEIDNLTYLLNCTKPFDYEYQQWYYLKFHVEDFNLNRTLQTTKLLTIRILDENDNAPQFLQSSYRLSLYENNQANAILTKVETYDPDDGDNGRLAYEIVSDEENLPFSIDSHTGLLRCLESFDREIRSEYRFEILVRDHGYPMSLSSKIPVQIDIDDVNDNKPMFEYDKYEFTIEENYELFKTFGYIRAYDVDLNTNLIYTIENENHFQINQHGELFLRNYLDRELQDRHYFIVTVSDSHFRTAVPVDVRILDVNDCRPQWKNPSNNHTKLFINKDVLAIGTVVIRLEAVDYDDTSNGNGLVNYFIKENYYFLYLMNNDELILNSTPNVGHYPLSIYAKDNGKLVQHSSLIKIDLFIRDNSTHTSAFYKINSLSTLKRVALLITVFISIILILIFIIAIILIMVCRYRKDKYLYYIKCNKNQLSDQKFAIIQNRSTDSSSDSSKLSLDDLHQKHLIGYSSLPSYIGANIYSQNHQISSVGKPTQTTSDYYSNSSKHDEAEEDEQRSMNVNDNNAEWSIEKILYPDWLYKDILMTTTTASRNHLNTSTFVDSNYDKRTLSSSNQLSPKQVRFGFQKQVRSYPHLSTTLERLKTRTITTTKTISNDDVHNTFI